MSLMNYSFARKLILGFIILSAVIVLFSFDSFAQIRLAWDPGAEPDLAGYKVYYGTASRTYGASIDVGKVTSYTLTGITPEQTYFIAVTAYDIFNNESAFSNEVTGVSTAVSNSPMVLVTLKAENFATKTTGEPIAGGYNIWANGYIEDSVNFPVSGSYDFTVTAYGSVAAGVWPNMEIWIDQSPIGNVTVNSASWSTYIIKGYVSAGIHKVAIAFTDDYYRPPEDRNLFVDKISIEVSTDEKGLVAWYTLDDGSGTIVSDSSGLGNNGVVNGGAAWTTGKVGGALIFDGIDGSVTVPHVNGLLAGNTAHTVTAWVNVTSLPSNRAWILLLGNEGTGAHHWLINSSEVAQLGVWNGGQVFPTLPVGQWKHIAVTFDGARLAWYVDGVLVGSSAATFDLEGMPLTLGEQHLGENNFNGMVDDVRIYNRALAAAEIATLAAEGISRR